MNDSLAEKVPFHFIRYANCWEDAEVLMKGLEPAPGGKILSIGSAGDNCFSLLTSNPSLLVAADINPTQLYLIELKKLGFLHFEYEELLAFLGFSPSPHRLRQFKGIRSQLSSEARDYWDKNESVIDRGIIHAGKFERYFQLFSKWILPWIHSRKSIEKLMEPKSESDQLQFYNTHWNNRRWKLLFKVFFGRLVMGKFGRDPEFLKQVEVPVGDFIYEKAGAFLKSTAAQNNFMLRYNLTGTFGPLLPHYLHPDHFQTVRSQLGQMELKQGYIDSVIKKYGNFNSLNLSDIFEYMDGSLFEKTVRMLSGNLQHEGRMAYWNLMVPRQASSIRDSGLTYLEKLSENLMKKDKGFYYSRFIVEQKV